MKNEPIIERLSSERSQPTGFLGWREAISPPKKA